jgi:ribosomal protein S18 acetylase RimI-like enzyme
MNIRIATAADTPELVEFNRAMALETEGKHLDADVLSKGVAAVFRDPQKGLYVVAEDAGNVVGCLLITFEWSDWRNGWFWWIQSVYVRPEARGKSVYSKLYAFVKETAVRASDVCGFRLYVDKENEHAQRVYEKLGMERSNYLPYEEMAGQKEKAGSQ